VCFQCFFYYFFPVNKSCIVTWRHAQSAYIYLSACTVAILSVVNVFDSIPLLTLEIDFISVWCIIVVRWLIATWSAATSLLTTCLIISVLLSYYCIYITNDSIVHRCYKYTGSCWRLWSHSPLNRPGFVL